METEQLLMIACFMIQLRIYLEVIQIDAWYSALLSIGGQYVSRRENKNQEN